jgi:very-short-patch-repair endonuclease
LNNAKTLRTNQTEAEQRLWYHLRAHRFMDMKFKRQKPMGEYIVDFVCEEHRLIVEIDGGQHQAEQAAYDQQRDAWLRGEGYAVLRFWNNDVMQNLEGVLEEIRNALTLSPGPTPASGRGELLESGDREPQKSPLPLAEEGQGEGTQP